MRALLTRFIAVTFVVATLLVPFAGNLAMAMGLADGRVLVLCTGTGLRTIILDGEGAPIEMSERSDACVLSHAVDTSRAVTVETPRADLLFSVADLFVPASTTPAPWFNRNLARAPPVL